MADMEVDGLRSRLLVARKAKELEDIRKAQAIHTELSRIHALMTRSEEDALLLLLLTS